MTITNDPRLLNIFTDLLILSETSINDLKGKKLSVWWA